MAITFTKIPLTWTNKGTEPSDEIKASGFVSGYRPPAEYHNYMFANSFDCIAEIQTKMNEESNRLDTVAGSKADKVYNKGFIGGEKARLVGEGGAAVGFDAQASLGFAGGREAEAAEGGAIGNASETSHGGAVGKNAYSMHGGAVGRNAITYLGAAVGDGAQTVNAEGEAITAIQLGEGVNNEANTAKFFDYKIMNADGTIPSERLHTSEGGFAGGTSAQVTTGGAVGKETIAENGAAVGNGAEAMDGSATGWGATTEGGGSAGNSAVSLDGGAVGSSAQTDDGGAVGKNAQSAYGGAVGNEAKTGDGFAGGYNAKTTDSAGTGIDAIQLGTGTNSVEKTMQVYTFRLMNADGSIPADRIASKSITMAKLADEVKNYIDESTGDLSAYYTKTEIDAITGDKSTLTTTAKDTLVAAINEINGKAATANIKKNPADTTGDIIDTHLTVGGARKTGTIGSCSFVSGGDDFGNLASGLSSAVVGGDSNEATGANCVVVGGASNTATGTSTAIIGADGGSTSGYQSVIAGGIDGVASGNYSAVLGGDTNSATMTGAAVVGGGHNAVTGTDSAIVGGNGNGISISSGEPIYHSAIIGGDSNGVQGTSTVVIGGVSNNAGTGSAAIIGGNNNYITSEEAGKGGGSVIAGSQSCTATATNSAIIGGTSCYAEANNSVVLGGTHHSLGGIQDIGSNTAIVGGTYNYTESAVRNSVILGGRNNAIKNSEPATDYSACVAGESNAVNGTSSVTIGGVGLTADFFQTIVGKFNVAMDGPATATSTDGSLFIVGNGAGNVSEHTTSNAFRVSANGICYGTSSFRTSGADFAEFFEWEDGNPNNEDRRGLLVTLDGEKIKLASADDDYILGAISATPTITGDTQSETWNGMYKKDIFGENIVETVEIPEYTDEETGKTVPARTEKRFVVNPDYDPEQKYVSREERPEWAAVGVIGKLIVIDDGTCQPNSYCKPSNSGTVTASDTGYRVLSRVDDTHVKILFR